MSVEYGGWGTVSQPLDFLVDLFCYMGPGVSMRKARWRSSLDRVLLREELGVQHSLRVPEAVQKDLLEMHVRLC